MTCCAACCSPVAPQPPTQVGVLPRARGWQPRGRLPGRCTQPSHLGVIAHVVLRNCNVMFAAAAAIAVAAAAVVDGCAAGLSVCVVASTGRLGRVTVVCCPVDGWMAAVAAAKTGAQPHCALSLASSVLGGGCCVCYAVFAVSVSVLCCCSCPMRQHAWLGGVNGSWHVQDVEPAFFAGLPGYLTPG